MMQIQTSAALVGLVLMGSVAGTAHAERLEVASLLTEHGGLNKRQAKRVAVRVSSKMEQIAVPYGRDEHPLRKGVTRALFGRDLPRDQVEKAKVRYRLYSGLTPWALGALFGGGQTDLAECRKALKLPRKYCNALLAAGDYSVRNLDVPGLFAGATGEEARLAAAPLGQAEDGMPTRDPAAGRSARGDARRDEQDAQPANKGAGSPQDAKVTPRTAARAEPAKQAQSHSQAATAKSSRGQASGKVAARAAKRVNERKAATPATVSAATVSRQAAANPASGGRTEAVHKSATARAAGKAAAAAPAAATPAQNATRQAYLARREAYLARQRERAEAAKRERAEALAASRVSRGPAANSVEAGVQSRILHGDTSDAEDAKSVRAHKAEGDVAELNSLVDNLLED